MRATIRKSAVARLVIKTVEERVAELIAVAPPVTEVQRRAVVQIIGPGLVEKARMRARRQDGIPAKAA